MPEFPMHRSAAQLRDDALAIWRAGVEAVQPHRLVPEHIRVDRGTLWIGEQPVDLASVERVAVVGAGKGAGALAAALEGALGAEVLAAHRAFGLVNVPHGAESPTRYVRLNAVRPWGLNEPTAAAVEGTRQILDFVHGLGPRDLCFCLLTGGGSALLPAPVEGFPLAEKANLTRELSDRGATILEINMVRRQFSRIKGGGLARACQAGRLITLAISDVPGDDLAAIASGPTVDAAPAPELAIELLERLQMADTPTGRLALQVLRRRAAVRPPGPLRCEVTNLVIGNNAAAVDGAGVEAERRGYSHAMISAREPEGLAEDVAKRLLVMARQMQRHDGPDCLITGGEPTVRLAPAAVRGAGGRNQQLALAALASHGDWRGMALVSAGTDGEDGPTDAAGAIIDERVAAAAARLPADARDFLARNDAYTYLAQVDALVKTGPTHTNVCDLRVFVVSRQAWSSRC